MTQTHILVLLVLLAAYLLGAVPFGYTVAKWRGVDILAQGSGNIGATNVGRVLGRRFGILVFLLDFAKGAVPVAAAGMLARMHPDLRALHAEDWLPMLAGLAAFLGHMFPVYLRFRGGKGVATGAGVVAVLVPAPALASFITWIIFLAATRYVSLASLMAALALCHFRLIFSVDAFDPEQLPVTAFCFVAAALVFLRHRSNIVRLLDGTESQVHWISPLLPRTLHVLALGLWFGSALFLNFVVAPVIFHKFGSLGDRPAAEERLWLHLPEEFDRQLGTRLAGAAVAPLFDWFYPLEACCGVLVALTALAWCWQAAISNEEPRLQRLRSWLAVAALATVVMGWPLGQQVGRLSLARHSADSDIAAAAKLAFGLWHTVSLLLSFITVALVSVLMALAARLPNCATTKDT